MAKFDKFIENEKKLLEIDNEFRLKDVDDENYFDYVNTISLQKVEIFKENEEILREEFYKYRNNKALLNDEIVDVLMDNAYNIGVENSIDIPLACDIYLLVQSYALENNSRYLLFKSTYKMCVCLVNMDFRLFLPRINREILEVLTYHHMFADLNEKERTYYHKSIGLYFYTLRRGDKRIEEINGIYQKILSFWLDKKIVSLNPTLDFNYLISQLKDNYAKLIVSRLENCIVNNIGVEPALEKAIDLLDEMLNEKGVMNSETTSIIEPTAIYFYYLIEYYRKRISIDQFLTIIEKTETMSKENDAKNEIEILFNCCEKYYLFSKLSSNPLVKDKSKRLDYKAFFFSIMVPSSDKTNEIDHVLGDSIKYFLSKVSEHKAIKLINLFILFRHMPTYVHSHMVNSISQVLLAYCLNLGKKIFVNYDQYEQYGSTREEKISNLVRYAAYVHDIGKIECLETVARCGRRLTDFEYEIIKSHPIKGADIINGTHISKRFIEVTKYHHTWYTNTGGYPHCDEWLPINDVIDLIAVADSIDAATDYFGRTYSKIKTLDEIIDEIKSQDGIRYATPIVEILDNKEVKEKISYIITEGRKKEFIAANDRKKKILASGFDIDEWLK